MKKALNNIRSAVLAGDMTLEQAAGHVRKFLPNLLDSFPGGIRYILNLPSRADRDQTIKTIERIAGYTVKHYYSDVEIDKQIIRGDDFGGVYAWAARECGTCLVRVGFTDGMPDDRGIEFFRACCANWRGLHWYLIDAQGYDMHMYSAKNPAEYEKLVNDRIFEMRELAAERAERAAAVAV